MNFSNKKSLKKDSIQKPRKILGMNNTGLVDYRLGLNDTITNQMNSTSTIHSNNIERMRLSNLIAQDFHTYWPYGQFISPICPSGVAMYPTTPSVPYPLPVYQSNNIPTNFDNLQNRFIPNASSNNSNTKTNEANNMTIQIGLQCVNQNNPVNINALNDLAVPFNSKTSTEQESTINNIDSQYSAGNVYVDRTNNNIEAILAKEFEKKFGFTFDIPADLMTDPLCQEKFSELTRMAMRGCELAERLAYSHRNRPCFKKIDSLCARMKQDLIRPDGVLPNINSQGIAWAVKDFIFVFTRVINAWIIIKGYVYNTPEGLNRVKSALSPDFAKSFLAWQDATMDFIENIIKSFLSLDQLVQNQKAAFQKVDNTLIKACSTSTPLKKSSNETTNNSKLNYKIFDDSYDFINDISNENQTKLTGLNENNISLNNKSYFSTLIEDSEESQRKAIANGTYFKTGVYNPLQKDSNGSESINPKKDIVNTTTDDLNFTWPAASTNYTQNNSVNVLSSFNNGEGDGKLNTKITSDEKSIWPSFEFRVLEKNVTNFSSAFDPTITKPIGTDLTEKLEILLHRISNLSEGKYFFTAHFTKNYFPDFTLKYPNFIDLRSVILKAQVGGYSHIFEIVHDLKLIIFNAKIYLKTNKNDLLKNSIIEYEKEIDSILMENKFKNSNFQHITGDPNETLVSMTE